jgi:hypothetical protein
MNTLEIIQPSSTTSLEIGLGVPMSAGALSGAYGSFYDVTTQSLVSAGQAKKINIGTTLESNQVSIEDSTEITFARKSVYSVTYSVQFANSGNQVQEADIWLLKNGTRIEDSNSRFDVPAAKGPVPGHLIASVNYVLTLEADDYLELEWTAANTSVTIETLPASNGYPRTPGIIVTAIQVANIQAPNINLQITNPQNGDILVYSNGVWINQQP